MTDTVTPKQAAALWTLLAAGGQGRKPPASSGGDDLIARGFLAPGYRGAGKTALVELTDRGWHWAGRHLGDPAVTPKPLLPWFEVIRRFLDARDLALADLIVARPQPLADAPVKPPRAAKAAKPKASKPPTPAALRKRIEAAYLAATGGRKAEAVALSAIRAGLAELDRATVDAALLRIIQGDRTARLGRISDPKAISPAERAAAFTPGDDPFHLLWIQPRMPLWPPLKKPTSTGCSRSKACGLTIT